MSEPIRYIRKKAILDRLGINDATFWSWRKTGVFPVPAIILNPGAARQTVCFPEDEVEQWLASRPRRMVADSPRRSPYLKGVDTRKKKKVTRPSE
jgi:predicted DNA-binding transcriptional regulator AlpA